MFHLNLNYSPVNIFTLRYFIRYEMMMYAKFKSNYLFIRTVFETTTYQQLVYAF